MFPGTGYFKSLPCPYFAVGLCERPFCHYSHEVSSSESDTTTMPSTSIEEMVQKVVKTIISKDEKTTGPESRPRYNPTPLSKLKGNGEDQKLSSGLGYSPTPINVLQAKGYESGQYIPGNLSQITNLHYKSSDKRPKVSRLRAIEAVTSDNVLGDIKDLSESDEEAEDLNVVGSILVQGAKSGVLGGDISEFEHEVLKNKMKKLKKAKEVSTDEETNISCNRVSSSNETEDPTPEEEKEKDVKGEKSEIEKVASETEELRKKIAEKEKELLKLEELEKKRKAMEEFYKSKFLKREDGKCSTIKEETIPSSEATSSIEFKEKESHTCKKQHRNEKSSHKSTASSKSKNSSSHNRSHKQDSKSSSKEDSKSSRGSSSHHKHKSHKSSSRESSSKPHKSSSTESSRSKSSSSKSSLERRKERHSGDDEKRHSKSKRHKSHKSEKDRHRSSTSKHRNSSKASNSKSGEPPGDTSNQRMESFTPIADNVDDEDNLPESVRSFLDVMSELDSQPAMECKDKNTKPTKRSHERKHSTERRGKAKKKEEEKPVDNQDTKIVCDEIPNDDEPEGSPLPDIFSELDELPDELNYFDGGDGEEEEDLKRIFDEYEPEPKEPAAAQTSSEETHQLVAEDLENEDSRPSKKRVAHQNASVASTTVVKRAKLTPAQVMMERFKKIQAAGLKQLTDPFAEPSTSSKKRIAHGSSSNSTVGSSSYEQAASSRTQRSRVAHAPSNPVQLQRPLIEPDPTSKVPTNVRQRYLNSIIDECLKIYHGRTSKAYERATQEESACSRRSKTRNIYLNLVVKCIKKLRDEASKAPPKAGTTSQSVPQGKPNLLTTHMQVLAGKAGTMGTWSIEKHARSNQQLTPDMYYPLMKRYILTDEQLEENGYPLPDPAKKGRAVVKEDSFRPRQPPPSDPDKRRCSRCGTVYPVDRFGHQTKKEDCVFHWGRVFKRRGNRATGPQSFYSCCDGEPQSEGCSVHPQHVTDVIDYNDMRGFVATLSSGEEEDKDYGIFAMDCEMCYTTIGNELTRVSVIDVNGKTVYDAFVKPDNDIIDYNTRFSGLTAKDLDGVTTKLRDVQAVLLSMFQDKTILIGHSLESDLKVLKLIHKTVIDTSVVFPHRLGPPYKRALRTVAVEYIQRIIQNDVGGHDSAEDAIACLDIMKKKITEDFRKLQQSLAKERNRAAASVN